MAKKNTLVGGVSATPFSAIANSSCNSWEKLGGLQSSPLHNLYQRSPITPATATEEEDEDEEEEVEEVEEEEEDPCLRHQRRRHNSSVGSGGSDSKVCCVVREKLENELEEARRRIEGLEFTLKHTAQGFNDTG